MVAPAIIAAGIGAGAQIFGGLLGSSAQKQQLKLQAQEAARQNLIDQRQLELAERMIEIGLATQVDAQGNITTYDEATNTWKVIPSAVQQQLINASNDEILRQFNYDAPMARGEALRNSARRAREGTVADGLLQDVQDSAAGAGKRNSSDIAGMLRTSRTNAVNQGFDEVGASVGTQALRSGSNGAGAAAQLAAARARAIAQVMGTPELEGIQMADDLNANKDANKINNYGALASRATASDGFAPTGSVAPALNESLQRLRSGGQNALQAAASGIANAGQPNSVPGVYNPAGVIGAIGNAGADLFSSLYRSKTGGVDYTPAPDLDTQKAAIRRLREPGGLDF